MRNILLVAAMLASIPTPALADIVVINGGPGAVTDFHMLVLRPGFGPPDSVPWGAGTSGADRSWNWAGAAIAAGGKLTIKDLRLVDGDRLGNNTILEMWWTRGGTRVGNEITLADVPEPATWAMLVAGFGMVGLAARRRRVTAAA